MKWFLEENFHNNFPKIEFGDRVVFIGSCFSQNMVHAGQESGFNFTSTEFGTLFHPIPIARVISESISESEEIRIAERDGIFSTFDSSGQLFAESKEKIMDLFFQAKSSLKSDLLEAKYLFITLGSSLEYTWKEEGYIVSNCHKLPTNLFEKKQSDLDYLIQKYLNLVSQIQAMNTSIEIVLTVSPVRHSKEGLVENNRSKSRLLLLCEKLCELKNVHYFPAYEMIIDQLRDHRFFKEDLVHPNEQAVKYVWKQFQTIYFSDSTVSLANEVRKKRQFFQHISLQMVTEREQNLKSLKFEELRLFLEKHPKIKWA